MSSSRIPRTKKTIGATEVVDFPEFGYFGVHARVDTGAGISSVHCTGIRLYETNGVATLTFRMDLGPGANPKSFHTTDYREKLIKNSSGLVEKRYVIKTQILFFGKKFTAEFSLANRSEMNYPVLLGRKFLRKRFVVDVSLKQAK